jgi:hypothetical protein
MQLQIPQSERDALLILTKSLAPQSKPDTVSVILDIDLFRERADYSSDSDAWNLLEAFRVRNRDVENSRWPVTITA